MELRPYQKECISASWDWFRRNPQGAPLLVLPTGAGKSICLAEMAKQVAQKGGDRRVMILAHRKELLAQNYEKLARLMPWGRLGLYSAGLNRRDTEAQIVVAGIQSVFRKAEDLGRFSLVLIDEVHLVPPDGEGRYRTLIDGLKKVNPAVRFAGLSATPYRLGSGILTQSGDIWTGIAYEANVRDLIDQGYLSPLISKAATARANLDHVAVRGGEFVIADLEKAFNRLDLVESAVEEIVRYGVNRKSWLIFAAGVAHAEAVAAVLTRVGIPCGVVTGETPPLFRDQTLEDFKAGRLRAVVNVDVLTTGLDVPGIDLIAVLRATKSTALWVQICGRGMRLAPGKSDCLILDFGGNALRHGPIDRIRIAYRKNPLTGEDESSVATAPVKECPACRSIVPLSAKECPDCGHQFPETMRLNHEPEASTAPVLSVPEADIEVTVLRVSYERHAKKGQEDAKPTLRVDYVFAEIDGVPVKKVSEWVCLEHYDFAHRRAVTWWRTRSTNREQDYPESVAEALERVSELRTPKRVLIRRDGKYWRVVKVLECVGEEEAAAAEAEKKALEAHFDEMGVNIF